MFVSKTSRRFITVRVVFDPIARKFVAFEQPRRATILGTRGNIFIVRVARSDYFQPQEFYARA